MERLIDEVFGFSEDFFYSWIEIELEKSNIVLIEGTELFLELIPRRLNTLRVVEKENGEHGYILEHGPELPSPFIKSAYIKSRLFPDNPILYLVTSKLASEKLRIQLSLCEEFQTEINHKGKSLFGLLMSEFVKELSKVEPGHPIPQYPDWWVTDLLEFGRELGIIEFDESEVENENIGNTNPQLLGSQTTLETDDHNSVDPGDRYFIELWNEGKKGPDIAKIVHLSTGRVYNLSYLLRKRYGPDVVPKR